MALSPNYGWAEPDNSSLVKNGAQDIRALGDAIDTSVWNVGYGQAGKNKLINSDFNINQRAFSSTTTASTFTFDRWITAFVDGTSTASLQTFTTGAAPVAGYESKNFLRLQSTGQTLTSALTAIAQRIENVRTVAGQTVTVSFWAKASSGTPSVGVWAQQSFGTGGSPSATVNVTGNKTAITTAWARYSITIAINSISGKTIGTNEDSYINFLFAISGGSDRNSYLNSLGIQTATIDFWGMQVEYGSKATPFQTATATIQGELAACQRYYYRATAAQNFSSVTGLATATSTTACLVQPTIKSTLRAIPTTVDFSGLSLSPDNAGSFIAVTAATISVASPDNPTISLSVASGLTQFRPYYAIATTAGGYLGIGAEL